MNLFKNRVGRPSNETIRKRKIFKCSVLCFTISLVFFLSILIYGNINNKGALFSGPLVTYSDNILGSKAKINSNIKVRAKFISLSKKTYYYDIVDMQTNSKLSINQSYCNAIPSSKKVDFSFILKENKSQYKINIYQNSNCSNKISEYKTRKYYIDGEGNLNLKYRNKTAGTTRKTNTTSNNSITMTKFVSQWSMGGSGTSTVTLKPSNATFTVKSSNTKVMRVSKINNTQYKIFAVAPGSATITATSSKGAKISYTYTVKSYEYPDSSRVQNGIKKTTTKNGVKIFIEKGCSNNVVNRYFKDINELPSYVVKPTKAVYFLTEKTFDKINPNNQNRVGQAMLGAFYIDVMCNKYHELVLTHEFAHNMDYYYDLFTGNGYISNQVVYSNLFNKYNGKILRNYSFTSKQEFFADSYSYYFHKYLAKTNTVASGVGKSWKYNNEIKKTIENTIKNIKELNW